MTGVLIKAMSKKGEEGLRTAYIKMSTESKYGERVSFSAMFIKELTLDPVQIRIVIKPNVNKYITPEALRQPITVALSEVGLKMNTDYKFIKEA